MKQLKSVILVLLLTCYSLPLFSQDIVDSLDEIYKKYQVVFGELETLSVGGNTLIYKKSVVTVIKPQKYEMWGVDAYIIGKYMLNGVEYKIVSINSIAPETRTSTGISLIDNNDNELISTNIMCIPGNNTIYCSTYRFGTYFTSKYSLVDSVLVEIKQAFYYWGKYTSAEIDIEIFSDLNFTNKVGIIFKGNKVLLIGIFTLSRYPDDKIILVSSTTGQVGYIKVEEITDNLIPFSDFKYSIPEYNRRWEP